MAKRKNLKANSPSEGEIKNLLHNYRNGMYGDAKRLALTIIKEFPENTFGWKVLGATLKITGKLSESVTAMQKYLLLMPEDFEVHNNLGNTLRELQRLNEAEASFIKSLTLNPDYAEANNNLGLTLKELGRLDEAEASLKKAIQLKADSAVAHNNLGNTLRELARLDEAKISYAKAIELRPDFADAHWNLHGIQNNIKDAEFWIDKSLAANKTHQLAQLTKAALRFYQGDRNYFDDLMQSKLKHHPVMRSFSWAFSLPYLPQLYFNKWHFFDAILKKSKISKPFYEFGVWRGSSFKYLINTFKKGYGFDTFTGLPEDWHAGNHFKKKGAYTSDGIVPNIKGGEFIIGKFQDTLPEFFSQSRPIASVINFDADLYSSTICALNFSKQVMDKDTILIFDEFIINESWEQDEFKALNEFCSINLSLIHI